jgi:hypothetical protein
MHPHEHRCLRRVPCRTVGSRYGVHGDDGWQAQIDDMYASCDGLEFTAEEGTMKWEDAKAATKTTVEACGCGGAAQAAPLFAALAAVANHFLN